ncbi:MAG: hypothetical protein II598_01980, partial [Elusimicrobia bacterium]|nr:hypothetical protein [Elusimicrobiota bacterium]
LCIFEMKFKGRCHCEPTKSVWQSKVVRYFEKIELSTGKKPVGSFASLKDKIFKEYQKTFFNDFI